MVPGPIAGLLMRTVGQLFAQMDPTNAAVRGNLTGKAEAWAIHINQERMYT